MKSLFTKIAGIFLVFSLFVNTIGIVQAKTAVVNTKTVSNHKQKNMMEKMKADTIWNFYVTAKGEIRAFTSGEDGVQSVYTWTGKKWKRADKDPLSDFTYRVNKKKFTGYSAPVVNKKGSAYYIYNNTDIYKYNKKGKILVHMDLRKLSKIKPEKQISDMIWLKKDFVVVQTTQPSGGIYLIDLKKKKVKQSYSKQYVNLRGGYDNYIYLESGTASEKTETISKVNAVTGKCVKKIETKNLRALGDDCTEEDMDYGLLKDVSLTSCVYHKKLYVKYVTGVYCWNEKKSRFDQIIDGSKDFGAGKLYSSAMQFASKSTLYVLGYSGDDEAPTDMYEYKI